MSGIDIDTLKHALGTARKLGLNKVEIEEHGESFEALLAWVEEEDLDGVEETLGETGPQRKFLTAPVVGYFRPLVAWEEGTHVDGGQPIGEVVALGLANDVLAPASGKLIDLAATADEAVEFGQILATIEVHS